MTLLSWSAIKRQSHTRVEVKGQGYWVRIMRYG